MALHRILMILMLLISAGASAAGMLTITDLDGDTLGRLPYLDRGQERLIPLSLLADKAGWQSEPFGDKVVFMLPGWAVTLRSGNPFAQVNESHLQLRMIPEEWDGSLWIAAENLPDLFGNNVLSEPTALTIGVKYVSTQSAAAEPWALRTVIIDAGHGGKDPGAAGLNGLVEKTVTLDISRRLSRLLESSGIRSVMTRDADQFIPLHERTSLANSERGDLFLSIHCNSSRKPEPQGLETYFLKPARTERAVEAAMRENEVVKLEEGEGSYQDLTEANFILLTMATSQYMKDSELWAALAQHEVGQRAGLPGRGVDQAGFYVLMGASMPAILFECGYLTNTDDAKLLSSERGRQKIAEGLAESILKIKLSLEASASR